jgi:Ca2+-transporting ATPase
MFTNKWMQYAVLSSLAIILAIIYVPALDPIFDTAFLGWQDWMIMLPLILLQGVAAEVTKLFLRMPGLQGWLYNQNGRDQVTQAQDEERAAA